MRIALVLVLALTVALAAIGCTMSKPYVMEVDRKDQVVDGNRGYLKGTPPPPEDLTGRKRPFMAVDVDIPPTSAEAAANKESAGKVKTTNIEVTSSTQKVTVRSTEKPASYEADIK